MGKQKNYFRHRLSDLLCCQQEMKEGCRWWQAVFYWKDQCLKGFMRDLTLPSICNFPIEIFEKLYFYSVFSRGFSTNIILNDVQDFYFHNSNSNIGEALRSKKTSRKQMSIKAFFGNVFESHDFLEMSAHPSVLT